MSFSDGFAMKVAEMPLQEGDLLDAVLVDRVAVGGGDGVGVAGVDLVLAVPGLALRELDRDPGGVHAAADRPEVLLVHRRGEDVVVEDVGDRRREVAEVLLVGLGVALLVEVELELGGEHRRVAHLAGALVLGDQDLARRGDDRGAVVVDDVAEDQRRAVEPRDRAAASTCRARSRSRRSPSPSWPSRSPGTGPSPCRARAGSCSPRSPCSITSSRKYSPTIRLPNSRPCMSVKAVTTVSIVPSLDLLRELVDGEHPPCRRAPRAAGRFAANPRVAPLRSRLAAIRGALGPVLLIALILHPACSVSSRDRRRRARDRAGDGGGRPAPAPRRSTPRSRARRRLSGAGARSRPPIAPALLQRPRRTGSSSAREDLATLEARNAGKPIADARGEIGMVAETLPLLRRRARSACSETRSRSRAAST